MDQIYPRMYLLKKTALGHLSIMHDSSTYVVRTMRSLISVLHFLFFLRTFFYIHVFSHTQWNKCSIYKFSKFDKLWALLRICFVVMSWPLSQNSYKLPQINTQTFRIHTQRIMIEFQKNCDKIPIESSKSSSRICRVTKKFQKKYKK